MKRRILRFALLFLFVIVFTGCTSTESMEDEGWKESSLFESGSYTMIGEEGTIGFIYDDDMVSRFYPNKVQSYMWHFWGSEEEVTGNLLVTAIHETSGEEITVLRGRLKEGGSLNGADQSMPSSMSLPKEGMWKLDAFIDEELFGTIFVRVHTE
ncbi:DUF4871 domain-containing protein [Bacillus alkalicellulosilyticus]|uniref:DUF4871 domain-containing protein n=1 Tax=Alkalihalobacterium alkalicellulosilyticum TaxID=1912214 RepID=UPI001FE8F955|nr:DUF4871 domain-containing protein [Bacillus alkalicellulosilyticus]